MMKIWVCVESRSFEFLIKNFIEDLYGIAPDFIKTDEYLERIEEIEAAGGDNVLVVDHDDLNFQGYVIHLYNSELDETSKEPHAKRGSTLQRQYIDFKKGDIYRLQCALDDVWEDLNRNMNGSCEADFLRIPIRHYDLAVDSGVDIYELDGEGVFQAISKGFDHNDTGASTYLKKDQSEPFFLLLEKRFNKKLGKAQKVADQISTVEEIASFVGIDAATIENVDKLRDTILEECLAQKDMRSLLSKLMIKESSYRALMKLCMYTMVHTTRLDSTLNSKRVQQKLITACIFKDISLDDSELKMLINLDHEFSRRTRQERLSIRHHPYESAKQLNQFLQFSQDELLLIERHHEKPDGTGFPKGLKADNMSGMQQLFITCYRFSHYLIEECSRGGLIDAAKLGSVVSRMVTEGYADKPMRRYFSAVAQDFIPS
jgi:hypothetical protein